MFTHSQVCNYKLKHQADLASLQLSGLIHALFASSTLKGFKSVAKHLQWLMAMEEEMAVLCANSTWCLVRTHKNTNSIGSKWIFRTKLHSDGTIHRYKAHLVVQGITQVPDLN